MKDRVGARVLPLRGHQRADPQARTEHTSNNFTTQAHAIYQHSSAPISRR
ncbi:hypothetical protein [Bowdeniella nasicola]|nr:hypothetical protein [Bowdeniella nasicola]